MDKQISWFLLSLARPLALPGVGATAETCDGMGVVSCPEQDSSTLVDFDCTRVVGSVRPLLLSG